MGTKLDEDIAWESNDVELLGVTINKNLRFYMFIIFVEKQTGS